MTARMFFVSIALCLPTLAGCSSEHSSHAVARRFHGGASLPLSGDYAALGEAFRSGFLNGIASVRDSHAVWIWRWHDNEGSSERLQAWIDSVSDSTRKAPDLLLGGFGTAVADVDLAPVRAPLLWFGDGASVANPAVWPLWPDRTRLHEVLASWIAAQDSPAVALVLADGAWTAPFFEDGFQGVEVLPHDPLIRRWDREMGQILASKPRTILCWNRPEDATSFVTRPLIAPYLSGRALLLPDGVPAPAGAHASRIRPLWQPSLPVDSFQIAFMNAWGRVVGRAVASSTRARVRDSLATWRDAFGMAACDSLRIDPPSGGWMPRLEIVADSAATR